MHYIILKNQMQYKNQRLYECLQNVGTRGKIIPVIKMELPERKNNRLGKYDYSQPGAYFITICTRNRQKILSNIVGDDAHIVPKPYGKIVEKYIRNEPAVEKYVIMPDHIHMIVRIDVGTMRASSPTKSVSSVVRSIKILSTKEIGKSIFQRSYYDHIIRNQQDYNEIWEYIENNPEKWAMTKTEKIFSKNT